MSFQTSEGKLPDGPEPVVVDIDYITSSQLLPLKSDTVKEQLQVGLLHGILSHRCSSQLWSMCFVACIAHAAICPCRLLFSNWMLRTGHRQYMVSMLSDKLLSITNIFWSRHCKRNNDGLGIKHRVSFCCRLSKHQSFCLQE